MAKRSPTTKAVDLLVQLEKDGQLRLSPPFQRDNVWTRQAKAYLIDTILHDLPIPLFFMQRGRSAQTGRPIYRVVDGQQRLRAIFEFMNDRFALSQSAKNSAFYRKKSSQLAPKLQEHIRNYDLIVEQLSDYSESEIRDIFERMNKYGVRLSPQELRHARGSGAFHRFVNELAQWPFWKANRELTL